MARPTPVHNLGAAGLIIRATWSNGRDDQRAALAELFRRGLWLGDGQDSQAIHAAGLISPESRDDRRTVLAAMGYGPAPLPLEARPLLQGRAA